MNNSNYYDFMTIADLKNIISDLPDEMLVVIPVVNEHDVNSIFAFRKVRTAGVLKCDYEDASTVLCLNGAADGKDISDQISYSGIFDVDVKNVLYGDFTKEGENK